MNESAWSLATPEMTLFSERHPGMQASERFLSERIVSSVVQKIASAYGLILIAERGCDGLDCILLLKSRGGRFHRLT